MAIAIACLRLFTFLPEPLFSFPFLCSRMTFVTLLFCPAVAIGGSPTFELQSVMCERRGRFRDCAIRFAVALIIVIGGLSPEGTRFEEGSFRRRNVSRRTASAVGMRS